MWKGARGNGRYWKGEVFICKEWEGVEATDVLMRSTGPKRGNVKWVLCRFACDIAILQGSKLKVVSRHIVVSLWVLMFSGYFYIGGTF